MNLDHPSFGHQYRLSRLAVRLRTFTVSELMRLTGIVDDTVYGFVFRLMRAQREYVQWEELPRATRGRPVKRYTLTDAGVDYLLERNARLAAMLAGEEEMAVPPTRHESHSMTANAEGEAEYRNRMAKLHRETVLGEILGTTPPVKNDAVEAKPNYTVAAAGYVKNRA